MSIQVMSRPTSLATNMLNNYTQYLQHNLPHIHQTTIHTKYRTTTSGVVGFAILEGFQVKR
ncbi:MAG: hypothetical protein ABI337_01635 [Nitrososphaera sp.]